MRVIRPRPSYERTFASVKEGNVNPRPRAGTPCVFLAAFRAVADDPSSARVSRLRAVRLSRGLSQRELAELTGIPLRSLERLDRGELDDLPFRWLINLSIALQTTPVEVIEDEWRAWKQNITPARPTPRPAGLPDRVSRSGYQRAKRTRAPRRQPRPGL